MMEISSQVTHLPGLQNALLIGRGGAALYAATAAGEALVGVSRGGAFGKKAPAAPVLAEPEEKLLGIPISHQGKAAFYMAIAMALHNFGYAIARSITVTLFTSGLTGYAGFSAAFPLAMSFVSPVSLALLMAYGNLLDKLGPRGALTWSTTCCAFVLLVSALSISVFVKSSVMIGNIPIVKLITGPLFVFREAYVQLLTSQYWSFIASVLTPNQASKWFAPIAGMTSIASALSGGNVRRLVHKFGLSGSLIGTSLALLLSLLGANRAYDIAATYNFTPKDISASKHKAPKQTGKGAQNVDPNLHSASIFVKAANLFHRVPVLWRLFLEILSSQGLTTVLNVCFVQRLETAFPGDEERAGWVGSFYASINLITMVLQFLVLPPLMTVIEPRDLWRTIPIISVLLSCFQAMQEDPSLRVVGTSFLVIKVIEYSARRMLDEMVFVPLDFESRFVGKEVIGVLGFRFGKSLMSLALFGLTRITEDFGVHRLSMLSAGVSFLWLHTAWRLSNLVPTRQEAEDAHLQLNKGEAKVAPLKKQEKKR